MESPWVLNIDSSGKPIALIPWHRAVNLIWSGKATPIEVIKDKYWYSPSIAIPQSRIIQTNEYVKVLPIKNMRVVKRVLFSRDGYCCQYCGKKLTKSTATVDHIKPRSSFLREGKSVNDAHTYTNCVTACAKCNVKKGDRSPYECGMSPITTPAVPSYAQVIWSGRVYCPIQAEYISLYFKVDKESLFVRPTKDLT